MNCTLDLKFPAGSWTKYTDYLINESVSVTHRLCNDEMRSTVDTCRFQLKYNQTLQAALFTASDWIECQVRDDFGPIAHYAFEGDATDSTVNGYNGTASGATYSTSGYRGGCASFDGSDDYVSLPSGVYGAVDTASDWTLSVWVKLDTLAPAEGNVRVLSFKEAANNKQIQLRFDDTDNAWSLYLYDETNTTNLVTAADSATTDWQHLCVTHDVSTGAVELYVNGASGGSGTNNTTINPDEGHIGGRGGTAFNFDGLIDEVRIYNKTLTAAQVKTISSDVAGPVFTGVIAPTFGLRKSTNVMPISVEAQDNSYLLDEPINTSFNYPATIGGSAYQIFNADDSSANVVWELLEDAGYTPASDIAATAPDITTTVEYFQGTLGDETYRNYLDDLLSEYGRVFYFDEFGKFQVYQWDKDTVTSTETIDEDMEIRKIHSSDDGFEVEFAATDTMTDALLYRDNLPITATNGVYEFSGKAIANNDYYPPDGDIDDIWQRYSTKWLDLPWLARETRLKNKDLRLIAADASDSTVGFLADDGIAISSSSYEALRAKVLFRNTSGDTASIYNFEIKGTALYRQYRRWTRCPDTSTKPREYVARFLYDGTLSTVEANATRFARAMSRVILNGNYKYYWTDRTDRAVGTIVTVNMTNPSVNQTVMIVERTWNPQRTTYDYVARGISAYSATTVTSRGEAPDVTPTQEQQIADLANATISGNDTKIGTSSNTNNLGGSGYGAVKVYMGYESGDNGQGFYIKEYNGTGWETRGYMRKRDPSTWLVVADLTAATSADTVGLS